MFNFDDFKDAFKKRDRDVISRIVLENSDSDAFDEDVKAKWNKAHGKNYFVRKECEVKHHD